jgi:PTS system mannose-specific IIA component
MVGTLILTQGGLAEELLCAARTIVGTLPATEALGLPWDDSFEGSREKVRVAIERLDAGQGVLVLTDMFGSTPTNVALSFLPAGRIEILSGVNLPMLLRLSCTSHPVEVLAELAHWLQSKGQHSICLGTETTMQRRCGPAEAPHEPQPVAMAEKANG